MLTRSIALALSIIAISLSGLTLAWTIGWSIYTHRRATRPSLKVTGAYGLPVYDLPDGRRDFAGVQPTPPVTAA